MNKLNLVKLKEIFSVNRKAFITLDYIIGLSLIVILTALFLQYRVALVKSVKINNDFINKEILINNIVSDFELSKSLNSFLQREVPGMKDGLKYTSMLIQMESEIENISEDRFPVIRVMSVSDTVIPRETLSGSTATILLIYTSTDLDKTIKVLNNWR